MIQDGRTATAYEFRPMIKHGPGFEIYPGRWARFWNRVARWFLGMRS